MKVAVAIVMGFFSGFLLYAQAALLLIDPGKGADSVTPAFYVLVGGWVATAYLLLRNARTVAKVLQRGFMVGAAEWLLMLPVGFLFAGKSVSQAAAAVSSSDPAVSSGAAAGAAIGGGSVTLLTGGLAIGMCLFCLLCYAVTYFTTREMKPEAVQPPQA